MTTPEITHNGVEPHLSDQPTRMSLLLNEIILDNATPERRERLDNPEELYALERGHVALSYIRDSYSLPGQTEREKALALVTSPVHAVESIGNQFGRKLINAYTLTDMDEAFESFKTIEPHTVDEEMALLIRKDKFGEIYRGLHAHLAEQDESIKATTLSRLDSKTGQISKDDRYQFNGNETARSLNEILRRGVTIQVMSHEAVEKVIGKQELSRQAGIPLTELLKNERILRANGFPDSKVSLAIHDLMDHAWGFWLMREVGLDTKFRELFESIGDPARTDIYKREGEIPASICFGVRYWATQEQGFTPVVSATDLRNIMEKYFDEGKLTLRHMEAFRILRNLTPESREWQSLGFDYSNYITELDEQRRKHGKIKQRDLVTHEIVRELPVDDPDFLAFFVEFHHQLMTSRNKHRDQLFRTHILFEEYLQGISMGTISPDSIFRVHVQNLNNYSYESSKLDPKVIRWMFKNYGFSATKDTLL